ncbi:MAG: hypothetical protein ACRD0P_10675 [Stackebrandtia sp.]
MRTQQEKRQPLWRCPKLLWMPRTPCRGLRGLFAGGCAVIVVAAGVTGCSDAILHDTKAADCKRLAKLSTSGQDLESIDAEVPKLPLPGGIADPRATVIERGQHQQLKPDESSIARPDEDVDTVVVAARVDGDLNDLHEDLLATYKAHKLRVSGKASLQANGEYTYVSVGYRAELRDGNVRSFVCDDQPWLFLEESLIPEPARSKDKPLPGRRDIAGFLEPIGDRDPYVQYQIETEEFDNEDGSLRHCVAHVGPDAYEGSGDTFIDVFRPSVAPEDWRSRVAALRDGPDEYLTDTCRVDGEQLKATSLPDGPDKAEHCIFDDTGAQAIAAATTIDGDYWIGIKHTDEDSLDSNEQRQQLATKILDHFQKL